MGALIPSGPLHPEDALAAVVVGLIVGLVARYSVSGPVLVVAAAGVTFEHRHGGTWDALVDRPAPLWALLGVLGATIVIAVIAAPVRVRSMRAAGCIAGVPLAATWGLVADTEAPLIAGMVLLGALVFGLGRPSVLVVGVATMAPFAAAIGSFGRPSQLPLALAASMVWAAAARAAFESVDAVRRRQRAGTPTTVESTATSSVTTAPAPTIAP